MATNFSIIIPARYDSTRLPGKPLKLINDKPLIQHVFETASATKAKKIIIATDNDEICNRVELFGGKAILTSSSHDSGTDRIAEVVEKLNFEDEEIVINLQGDEYGLSPLLINKLASNLSENKGFDVATLCKRIDNINEYTEPNIVKVVFNSNYKALYFSRSPIPIDRRGNLPKDSYKHIGIYAYRVEYLKKLTKFEKCDLEISEQLEQLRILYNDGKIHIGVVDETGSIGIDTEEDLEIARSLKRN